MRTVKYITKVKMYLRRNKLSELYTKCGYKDFHPISSYLFWSFLLFIFAYFFDFFEDFSDFFTIYIGISTNQSR